MRESFDNVPTLVNRQALHRGGEVEADDGRFVFAREAGESPDLLKEAPHGRPVRRLDEVRAAKQPILRYAFDENPALVD